MRAYLAMQEFQSGKPSAREFYGPLGRIPGPVNTYGGGMLMNADSSSPGKVGRLTCRPWFLPTHL